MLYNLCVPCFAWIENRFSSNPLFLTGKAEKATLSVLAGLCILFSLSVSFGVFQDSISSADEWSYLVQARIFSEGELSVPSPIHREFFDHVHIVNNGRYYSKYPPGWPGLLTIGVLFGAPRLVNPLLGAGTLLLLYAIGKKLYTPQLALLAALCALLSPYFLFNTASYFPHTASLFFVALLLFLLMKGWEERSGLYFFLAGLSGSASLLVRPFDQFVVLIPVGVFLIYSMARRQVTMRHIALLGVGHVPGFLVFLLYNALQNGHPLVTGYHVADGWMDKWFGPDLPTLAYNIYYLFDLVIWSFPFLPLLALVALFAAASKRAQGWERCFAAIFLSLVVAYSILAFHEGPALGPRYYYSGFLAIPLLGAKGFARISETLPKRLVIALFLGAVALNVGIVLPYHSARVSHDIYGYNDFERQAQRLNPGPALVFLTPDPESGQASTRNRIDFQGEVVYAIDKGEQNFLLMQGYPGRRYFLYKYDRATGQSTLRELPQNRPD